MQPNFCPFGPAFVKLRAARQITQWHVSATCRYHVTNLSKVEKGTHQPGVMLALRLVIAAGADAGEFFQRLWEENLADILEGGATPQAGMPPIDIAALRAEDVRCPFGPLLLQVRLHNSVAQRTIAETVGYNLRNMGKVEKGQQEPGIMTALDMVAAAGGEVGAFFHVLHKVVCEETMNGQRERTMS